MRLAACLLGLSAIWLVVLPMVAKERRTAAYLHWLDERGIDPSAMYYTELDAMKPILDRLEGRAILRESPAE